MCKTTQKFQIPSNNIQYGMTDDDCHGHMKKGKTREEVERLTKV